MHALLAIVALTGHVFGDAPEEDTAPDQETSENEPARKLKKAEAEGALELNNELGLRGFNLVFPRESSALYAAVGLQYARRVVPHLAFGGFADFGVGSYSQRATIVRVSPMLRADANPSRWFRVWAAVALPFSSRGSANEYSAKYAGAAAIEAQLGVGLESSRVLFAPFAHAGVEFDTGNTYVGGGVQLALKF